MSEKTKKNNFKMDLIANSQNNNVTVNYTNRLRDEDDIIFLDSLNKFEENNRPKKLLKASNKSPEPVNMLSYDKNIQSCITAAPQKSNFIHNKILIDSPSSKLTATNKTKSGLSLLITNKSRESEESDSLLKFI